MNNRIWGTAACLSLMLLFVMPLQGNSESAAGKPRAVKGILDLSHYNMGTEPVIDLSGEWEFYWKKLYTSADLKQLTEQSTPIKPDLYFSMPGIWNKAELGGKNLPGFGYAAMRLKIKLNPNDAKRTLWLKLPHMISAYTLLANNTVVASNGTVGISRDTMTPQYLPKIVSFTAHNTDLELLLHISNFYNNRGGLLQPIKMGSKEEIEKEHIKGLFLDIFGISAIIIMGLYYFGLFSLRREEKSSFYFSLLCISTAALTFFFGREHLVIQLFPEFDWEIYMKIVLILVYLLPTCMIYFFYDIFPEEIPQKATTLILGITAFFCLTVFPPAHIGLRLFSFFIYAVMPLVLFIYAGVIKAAIRKKEGAILSAVGFTVMMALAFMTFLSNQQVINIDFFLSPFGLLFFLFLQSYLLTRRFSNAFESVERLSYKLEDMNINLEKKVIERTRELHDAMDATDIINSELIKTRDRLWGEVELAKKIQTLLLPSDLHLSGYDISAYIEPAKEVGGDYYDLIRFEGKEWIVIGDVSGHGISAGLVMMMVQSAIHVSLYKHPGMKPSELLNAVNAALYDIINKINESFYMTITVLAYHEKGTFHFSGLHQDILIYRASSDTVEVIETEGMWIGVFEDIDELQEDKTLSLNSGDVMLLYTDGVTEAWLKGSRENNRTIAEHMYTRDRLIEVFSHLGTGSALEVRQGIVSSLNNYTVHDDVTIFVIKRLE
ncbi:MAG: SpoIIE family protein phosphatase [bacterium]|nr:SpoIIE family protein phosphatase [bacterium]